MLNRTLFASLAAATLCAAPLAAQDTTKAQPAPAPRADSIAVTRPAAPPAAPAAAPAPAAPAAAEAGNEVSPGMSQADVVSRWGEPGAVRSANTWTYLFYQNGREEEVGYYDVVFLHNGKVVDAIVRSPDHVYTGQSSSPEGREPVFTRPDTTKGATVTGVRVQPGP